jgi:nucleoside-diphosphate-sugar epimerase
MRLDLVVHQMVVQARSRGSIPVLGDGLQWRPFVHVADVCEAMLLLLRADADRVSGELFNLGGDHLNLTVRELAEQVGAAVGVNRVHSYPGLDDRSHRMNFAKIREKLGFVPSRSVSDGAREVGDALGRGDVDVDDPKDHDRAVVPAPAGLRREQPCPPGGPTCPAIVTAARPVSGLRPKEGR